MAAGHKMIDGRSGEEVSICITLMNTLSSPLPKKSMLLCGVGATQIRKLRGIHRSNLCHTHLFCQSLVGNAPHEHHSNVETSQRKGFPDLGWCSKERLSSLDLCVCQSAAQPRRGRVGLGELHECTVCQSHPERWVPWNNPIPKWKRCCSSDKILVCLGGLHVFDAVWSKEAAFWVVV